MTKKGVQKGDGEEERFWRGKTMELGGLDIEVYELSWSLREVIERPGEQIRESEESDGKILRFAGEVNLSNESVSEWVNDAISQVETWSEKVE